MWIKTTGIPFWLINIDSAFFIVCIAKAGQFFTPNRYPDLRDFAYGFFLFYFEKIIIKFNTNDHA